ncbi:MAG: glycosyltransferase [Sphingobium sp.]
MTAALSILIPIHSFEPGGVERVGLNLADSWRRAGHDVTILLGRDEGPDRAQAPQLNYRRHPTIFSTARFETLWMIWCMLLYLRRHRPDVIFCAGNSYAVVCVAMRLLRGRSCPPIVTKISNDLIRRDMPYLWRAAYGLWLRIQGRLFDRIVGMAKPMRGEITRLMRVEDDRIVIIPDPALRRERLERLLTITPRPSERGLRFVAIGRLAPQKNFSLLLQAFAAGSFPDDRLTIVGDGAERPALEALACSLHLKGKVTFKGHLQSPDQVLEQTDCLLLTSHYEGVPAVIVEAIAAGLAIIATDCSQSMAELTGHGSRGVLVPVGDIEGLVHWISRARALPRPDDSERQYAAAFVVEEACNSYLAVMHAAINRSACHPVCHTQRDAEWQPRRSLSHDNQT